MELRDFSYFLGVIEAGSISKAASQLHVAQPTISQALMRIEREIGRDLIHRSNNKRAGLRLTDAGKAVAARAQKALQEIEAIPQDLSALDGMLSGEVHLAGIQSLNLTFLPRVLALFAQRFPHIDIGLNTHPSGSIPERVRNGNEDIGIVAMAPQTQELHGLSIHELYQEEFVAIVRNDHPLAAKQAIPLRSLEHEELLLVNRSSYTGAAIISACTDAGFSPKTRLELESGEALRECVRAGLGMCILPAGYLTEQERELKAIRLIEPSPTRQVLAVSNSDSTLSQAAKSFLTVLQECAKLS